ncbi:MAG: hypothetical protein M5R41_11305 [Bacteroidia bacterium]|nr:hypothetical protein [Bacteroidia bacterium]
MKTTLTALILCLAFLSTTVHAQQPVAPSERQAKLIETNVIANLQHPSLEVRAGTMQLLIDMKKEWPQQDLSYAVLPMLETLKSDEKPEFRILAALALYHLDSDLGRFAVERRAKYDSSERVAKHCAALVKSWDNKSSYGTNLMAEVHSMN